MKKVMGLYSFCYDQHAMILPLFSSVTTGGLNTFQDNHNNVFFPRFFLPPRVKRIKPIKSLFGTLETDRWDGIPFYFSSSWTLKRASKQALCIRLTQSLLLDLDSHVVGPSSENVSTL